MARRPHRDRNPNRNESTVKAVGISKSVQPAAPPPRPSPTREDGAKTSPLPQAGAGPGVRDRDDAQPPANATLQQRRAHFALQRIRILAEEWEQDADKQKAFNSYASAMPFMIHANGLGQTAAFYRRKGPEHTYYRLYMLLGDWLSQMNQPFSGKTDLLEGITQSDMDTYLAAQTEAMLLLDWVKKLASAFLAREEEGQA